MATLRHELHSNFGQSFPFELIIRHDMLLYELRTHTHKMCLRQCETEYYLKQMPCKGDEGKTFYSFEGYLGIKAVALKSTLCSMCLMLVSLHLQCYALHTIVNKIAPTFRLMHT